MPRRPARHALAAASLVLVAALVAACSSAAPGSTSSASVTGASAGSVEALPAEISTADALALRDSGAFMLDVRQPDEWAAGHIPGATLIPLGDLPGRLAEVPMDRQVVVVCRSGNRSAQGRDILLGAGYPSVTSMAGGMKDWIAADYPTQTGS